jgi:hypothetical protein
MSIKVCFQKVKSSTASQEKSYFQIKFKTKSVQILQNKIKCHILLQNYKFYFSVLKSRNSAKKKSFTNVEKKFLQNFNFFKYLFENEESRAKLPIKRHFKMSLNWKYVPPSLIFVDNNEKLGL